MNFDEFKYEAYISIDMKSSDINSNKPPSSYDQLLDDLIKWPLLKSTYFHSHRSHVIKHISFVTLEGDTLLQLQKWWYAIISDLCPYFSTSKIWSPYKSLRV